MIKVRQHATPPPAKVVGGEVGSATGYRYWTMHVSNLDAMLERCKGAGVKVTKGPVDLLGGMMRLAFVEDPDGNLIELLESKAAAAAAAACAEYPSTMLAMANSRKGNK